MRKRKEGKNAWYIRYKFSMPFLQYSRSFVNYYTVNDEFGFASAHPTNDLLSQQGKVYTYVTSAVGCDLDSMLTSSERTRTHKYFKGENQSFQQTIVGTLVRSLNILISQQVVRRFYDGFGYVSFSSPSACRLFQSRKFWINVISG